MNERKPDLSPLLPDDATLQARRAALVDAVSSDPPGARPGPGWRRRGPRLALGGTVALVAVAVALVVAAGGDNPPAAVAVEPQAGGGVRIKVYSLEDAPALEDALEDAGIRAQVNWLPAGTTCSERTFTPSVVKLPGGGDFGGLTMGGAGRALTISVGSTRQWHESFGEHRRGEISDRELANINLDPAAFRPDQSVVLFGSPRPYGGDPVGGFEARVLVAEGAVEACNPVPAPAGSIGAIGIPQAGGEGSGGASLQEEVPGEGQTLYTRTEVVQLQGWLPNGPGTGSKDSPRYFTAHIPGNYPNAPVALVATLKEVWTAPDGKTRVRETLGRVAFLSETDQRRWEAAGSPPPFEYDSDEHAVRRDGSGRLVKEYSSRSWRGRRVFANVSKLSALPTAPEALREAIENNDPDGAPAPARSDRGRVTAERLVEILGEPITSRALRAAALEALTEIPGIELRRGVADLAGRRGDAIAWVRDRGFGLEIVFDPRTWKVLANAEVIFEAKTADYPQLPNGTVFRGTAYLQSRIVDAPMRR